MNDLPESFPKPTHSLPGLALTDRLSDIEELRDFLHSRGIQTHNTRIARYQRYLEQASDETEQINESEIFKTVSDERFQSSIDWYLYILREVNELSFIIRGLKKNSPKGADEKLQKIVSGSDFAALDKNTESRNTQYELRIASYFCHAEFDVDLTSLTDIIATKGRDTFYIECKRVSNNKQLKENILKAKNQLISRLPSKPHATMRYHGVIALDVTKVAYNHNGITMGITNDHAKTATQQKLIKISNTIKQFNFFSRKPKIILCWLQIHIPCLIQHPQQTITRFSSYFIYNNDVIHKSRAALELLQTATDSKSFADPRETAPKPLSNAIHIPAGSEFWIDQEALKSALEHESNSEYVMKCYHDDLEAISAGEKIIGKIKMNGKDYEFKFIELSMFTSTIPINIKNKINQNSIESKTAFLCELFLWKHPFHRS